MHQDQPTFRAIELKTMVAHTVTYFLREPFFNIDVAFEFGALLADPDGIFDRRGKQVGFVLIRSPNDIRRAAFKRMLKAAVALPADRATRLALVRSGATPDPPRRRPHPG